MECDEYKMTGLKKKDFLLIIIVICAALVVWAAFTFLRGTDTGSVVVKVDGEIEAVYSLGENREVSINGGTNILKISDGTADITEADCPDQICVKQRSIAADHESIICLPNKVVVEISSDRESGIDASTN
ncbi:MAG: NusG domain II-containing protein [Dorea sp.]|jgi:hypothetical protein